MNFNLFNLAPLVAIVFVNGVIPVVGDCVQDYNQGSTLQCGPGQPPCVALKDEGTFVNEPNVPLACDDAKQVCQYPEYSALTVQCNQGPVEISWAGANNAFNSTANNAITYFISNQCTQPSSTTSTQDGDTLLIDCNPLKGDGSPCAPDYNFARQLSDPAAFQCGPGAKDCVALVGQEGTIIQSPNTADACDPTDRFCAFPEYSEFTVQCNQGTVTAQFNGSQNTFQNHAQNSFAYWMSNKCTGPSNELSTQDGDLLVVDCNPLAANGPE